MIILAVDTTSEHASFVLLRNGVVAAERRLDSRDGFARVLFAELRELLRAAHLRLDDVDVFASASGPGSFTGVRVGLAAAKGLASALDKPVYGISNLRALSLAGSTHRRAVLLDARRGDVFGAVYDAGGQLVRHEMVGKLPAFLQGAGQVDEFICQPGFPYVSELTGATLGPVYLAVAVAQCAEADALAGVPGSALTLDANYVRRSDAELFWAER